MRLKRTVRALALRMSMSNYLPNSLRLRLVKMGGVKCGKPMFIGQQVIFDSLYPENIEIGDHVHITMGCIFLTHSLDTSCPHGVMWRQSKIKIGNYAFVGARTIICNNVEIGENSIVGAGSIVTRSIPPNEIWAGNPARFIKKRHV
jgi:acetyltransferase-like isoleucine patch superfamily enzyme